MDETFIHEGNVNGGSFRFFITTPFYPVIKAQGAGSDSYTLNFTKAYIFDYVNAAKRIDILAPEFTLSKEGSSTFYVEIRVSVPSGAVSSAEIKKDEAQEDGKALAVKSDFDSSGQTQLIYKIELATFEGPCLQDIFLRENIHWFLRNFQQLGSPGSGSFNLIQAEYTDDANSMIPVRALRRVDADDNLLIMKSEGDYISFYVPRTSLIGASGGNN